ncbi:hypothetical protein ACY2HH_003800, partial [Acinetobacter baumannii]
GGLCRTSSFTLPGHEYTIRTLVEQHNIAEAYTLKT